ncbi:SDR family NAD(P)-dependent oxidoreductase [Desulfovibrio psychrotolerans]|uniref:NAD-dependent dehydratase n=1 Tax=Desulfovibrio psychrotolerans TaxID=415242 RepID=A0A7J0BWN4_9BACT|nr:SDR family NAD(P)-dependent oxidoreductase [Desulfovibrio psychrotolerans]GFM38108.1 NAD-dependent dehydratase [Desulfovibrio psychrotolerans]
MTIQSKNILVTGADGFIGSHLTETLARMGANVRALSYYNSFNDWGWLDTIDLPGNVNVVTGDIRDPHFCRHICKDIDIVFHLAALIAIPFSYVAPDCYVDTNVRGTLNICQAALDMGCSKVIHTSTSEVYGTALSVPISEEHPLQAQSPYSASKIGADAIANSFHTSFDLPVVTARPFNTFGPRQSARAVIPNIIIQLAAGKTEIALGDTRPTRDFNYVLDTCRGFIALAEYDGGNGEVFNIGSGRDISILDLFSTINDLMGTKATIKEEEQRFRPKKSEVMRLLCDSSKIAAATGFRSAYTLEDGLKDCIAWFSRQENLKRYKIDIYNV